MLHGVCQGTHYHISVNLHTGLILLGKEAIASTTLARYSNWCKPITQGMCLAKNHL